MSDEPRDSSPAGPRLSRRAVLAATGAGGPLLAAAGARAAAPAQAGRDYLPVVVPNGSKLPWKVVGGVKVTP